MYNKCGFTFIEMSNKILHKTPCKKSFGAVTLLKNWTGNVAGLICLHYNIKIHGDTWLITIAQPYFFVPSLCNNLFMQGNADRLCNPSWIFLWWKRMRALQQINAMTMCSAADESRLSSFFMENFGFPARRDGGP